MKEYGILVKYGRGTEVTAGLHPVATAVYSEMEEEASDATVTFETMLKHSGDLDAI